MTNDQFRQWRDHMGLTKRKAAEWLGISPRTLDLYEAGHRNDTNATVSIPRSIELACAALAAGIRFYDGPAT